MELHKIHTNDGTHKNTLSVYMLSYYKYTKTIINSILNSKVTKQKNSVIKYTIPLHENIILKASILHRL